MFNIFKYFLFIIFGRNIHSRSDLSQLLDNWHHSQVAWIASGRWVGWVPKKKVSQGIHPQVSHGYVYGLAGFCFRFRFDQRLPPQQGGSSLQQINSTKPKPRRQVEGENSGKSTKIESSPNHTHTHTLWLARKVNNFIKATVFRPIQGDWLTDGMTNW